MMYATQLVKLPQFLPMYLKIEQDPGPFISDAATRTLWNVIVLGGAAVKRPKDSRRAHIYKSARQFGILER